MGPSTRRRRRPPLWAAASAVCVLIASAGLAWGGAGREPGTPGVVERAGVDERGNSPHRSGRHGSHDRAAVLADRVERSHARLGGEHPGRGPAGSPETSEPGIEAFPPAHRTVIAESEGRHGFISTCPFVRSAAVDPIVFPGSTTDSHEHDFFGNTSTDEDTSTGSLVRSGTTSCEHADDLSAYWVPSAHQGGVKAEVLGTSMYYFTDKVRHRQQMQSMPTGLRMVAGDPSARAPQADQVGWFEEHRNPKNNTRGSRDMITARNSSQVTLRVNFPQCWNGTELDSPDHRSHMAYVADGECPRTHPHLLPQLTMFVRYRAVGGSPFELSSGPWHTMHADFWNAWHPGAFEDLLSLCRQRHCGRVRSG